MLSPGVEEATPGPFHAWFSGEIAAIDELMGNSRHPSHDSLIHLFLPDAVVLGIGQRNLGEMLDYVTGQSRNSHRLILHPVKEPLTAQEQQAALEAVRADLAAFVSAAEARTNRPVQ